MHLMHRTVPHAKMQETIASLLIAISVSVGFALTVLVFICARLVVALLVHNLGLVALDLLLLRRLVCIGGRLALESSHLAGDGVCGCVVSTEI